ncbi:MAG: DUF6152 family protein [Bryobacteraceae bacterium]
MKLGLKIALAGVLAGGLALEAHHSFSSEFDAAKPIKVTAMVTKVEWSNPHVWFYVDVKDESGRVTNWSFETSAPILLTRRGVTKETLKVADTLKIEGYRAKDGTNTAAATYVTFPDGKRVFTGAVGSPTD